MPKSFSLVQRKMPGDSLDDVSDCAFSVLRRINNGDSRGHYFPGFPIFFG